MGEGSHAAVVPYIVGGVHRGLLAHGVTSHVERDSIRSGGVDGVVVAVHV